MIFTDEFSDELITNNYEECRWISGKQCRSILEEISDEI